MRAELDSWVHVWFQRDKHHPILKEISRNFCQYILQWKVEIPTTAIVHLSTAKSGWHQSSCDAPFPQPQEEYCSRQQRIRTISSGHKHKEKWRHCKNKEREMFQMLFSLFILWSKPHSGTPSAIRHQVLFKQMGKVSACIHSKSKSDEGARSQVKVQKEPNLR